MTSEGGRFRCFGMSGSSSNLVDSNHGSSSFTTLLLFFTELHDDNIVRSMTMDMAIATGLTCFID